MRNHKLRIRAEAAAETQARAVAQATHELHALVHELQVHQIELELQNEELRSARMESEQARAQYSELFHAAPTGYLTVDRHGSILSCNRATAAMLRQSERALVGQPLERFVAHADRQQLSLHLSAAQEHGRASCELQLNVGGGAAGTLRLDTSRIPSCPGHALLVLTDMSERQRAQEMLEQMNGELERRVNERTSELTAQNERLQAEIEARAAAETRLRESERLQSLGSLAAGIAHDFNNLLVAVVGNAEMLLRSPELPSTWSEPLTMIRQTGQDAAELTRQLLVFAGQGRMERTHVQLSEIVEPCIELLRPRFGAVEVSARLAEEREWISADRSQLQRIVMNLVTNALEALNGRGKLEVGVRSIELDATQLDAYQHTGKVQPGRFVVLHVADTGRGIDPAKMQRIFEPFYSTKFTGRGLGLATVLGIVHSHGGAIRVSSRLGEGTRFDLAFPRVPAQHAAEPELPPVKDTWRASGAALLIDDNDDVRRVVTRLLVAMGFDVAAASSGESGLALLAGGAHFDVVVLDWLMPNMSGEVVLRELRRRDPLLPVVLISGNHADSLGREDRLVTRIQKPMTFEQLRAALRKVTADAPARRSARSG